MFDKNNSVCNTNCIYKIVQNKETGFLFSRFEKYLHSLVMQIFFEEESMKKMKFIELFSMDHWYNSQVVLKIAIRLLKPDIIRSDKATFL